VESNETVVPLTKGVIAVDVALCTACRTCEGICALHHHGVSDRELSRIQVTADFLDIRFSPKPCLQCTEPLCMEVCPVDAIYVDETTGARVVNADECIGCEACIDACATCFDPPRMRFDPVTQVAAKCDLCSGDPQCVRFCPTGALTYVFDSSGIRSGHPTEVSEDV
jgi:Fe-S-cluster-containing hydrogenase component 2